MRRIFGKILTIHLTRESSRVERLPESFYKDFLGGKGLTSHILLEGTLSALTRCLRTIF